MLDKLQNIYTFLCECGFDEEIEKYIKYLAQMAYNYSLRVNQIDLQPKLSLLNTFGAMPKCSDPS